MELFKKLGLKSGIRNLLAASSENTLLLLKSTVCEISSSHNLRDYCFIFWSREWQHTPVFLPGMFHRQRSLMGYSPRDHKDSDVNSETTFAVFALSHPTFVTPWAVTHQASLSFTISQSLFKLMSIESVIPSNCLILCHHFLLLPSIFPSIRGLFQWIGSSYQSIAGQSVGVQSVGVSASVLPM